MIFKEKMEVSKNVFLKKVVAASFAVIICLFYGSGLVLADTTGGNGLDCSSGNCLYTPLEPLPGITSPNGQFGSDNAGNDFYAYVNGIILLLVIIGSMVALVRFSIGGIVYMTSEIVDKRSWAKSQMWACIWGLLLLISSVLILRTINPQLVNLTSISSLRCLAEGGQPDSNGTCITFYNFQFSN